MRSQILTENRRNISLTLFMNTEESLYMYVHGFGDTRLFEEKESLLCFAKGQVVQEWKLKDFNCNMSCKDFKTSTEGWPSLWCHKKVLSWLTAHMVDCRSRVFPNLKTYRPYKSSALPIFFKVNLSWVTQPLVEKLTSTSRSLVNALTEVEWKFRNI